MVEEKYGEENEFVFDVRESAVESFRLRLKEIPRLRSG